MKIAHIIWTFLGLVAGVAPLVRAAPGDLDPTFTTPAIYPYGVALQPDGKIVVGGEFTKIGQVNRSNLARLNANGTLDTSFVPGTTSFGLTQPEVDCLAVQADGKILAGGAFTTLSGGSVNFFGRLTATGSLDSYSANVDGSVLSCAIQPDGKAVIGGKFTTVNGVAGRVARLTPSGSRDAGFDSPSAEVDSIAIQGDGKIVMAGMFGMVGTTTRYRIARLNSGGTLDTSLNAGEVLDSMNTVAIQPDGKFVVAGNFYQINGTSRANLARLNSNGSVDTGFNWPRTISGGYIPSVVLQADGKMIVTNHLTVVGGTQYTNVARLNANGSLDNTFKLHFVYSLYGLMLQPDGKVLVLGSDGLERLQNSPATQSLAAVSTSRVQWLRGGSSPEAQSVSFELSTDGGSAWTMLGQGTRISGGWELTGLNLPLNGQIRGRARIPGGRYNGSSGLIETIAPYDFVTLVPALTAPVSGAISTNPISIAFSLPEQAFANSVQLTFAGAQSNYTVTLANSQATAGPHAFTIDPANPLLSPEVASGAAIPEGNYNVSISYQDSLGNPAAASNIATNVLIDTTAPVLTLPSPNPVEALGADGAPVNFAVSTTDNLDPNPSLNVDHPSGSKFPIGQTLVTVSSTDAAGNTKNGSFTVTVQDTTAPAVSGDFAPLVLSTGPSGTVVWPDYLPLVTATDAVGVTSVSQNPAAGSLQPAGLTTVTISAKDAAGNIGTATFDVQVNDATPPDIAAPAGGFLNTMPVADANGMLALPDYTAQAVTSDNVAVTSVTQEPPPGDVRLFGQTTVTLTAHDAAGNTRDTSFAIVVLLDGPVVKDLAAAGGAVPGAGVDPRIPSGAMFTTFGLPAVADRREVAFLGKWKSGRVAGSGIFVGTSPALLVATGEDAPGIAGAQLATLQDPLLAPDGSVAFAGTVKGKGLPAAQNLGVWMTSGGAPALVLRKGTQIAGAPDNFILQSVLSLSLRDGELLALVRLAPAGRIVTAGTDTVLLRVTTAGATVLVREGDPLTLVPGQDPSRIKTIASLLPATGSPGQGRWHGDGAAVAKVTVADGRQANLVFAADGSAARALSVGDGLPNLPDAALLTGFGLPGLDPSGHGVVVRGALSAFVIPGVPPVVTPKDDNVLAFSPDTTTPFSMFAREGSPAPEADGANFGTFSDPLVNDQGEITFTATMSGKKVTAANKTGLWSGPPGDLKLLARTNSFAPDPTGQPGDARWQRFISYALPSGPGAGPVILANVRGTGITAHNNCGLWAVDSAGQLRQLLRTGDFIDGKAIAGLQTLAGVPGALGAARGFNARGTIALRATLVHGGQCILRVDVPDGAERIIEDIGP